MSQLLLNSAESSFLQMCPDIFYNSYFCIFLVFLLAVRLEGGSCSARARALKLCVIDLTLGELLSPPAACEA
jgi:hypothetical protein